MTPPNELNWPCYQPINLNLAANVTVCVPHCVGTLRKYVQRIRQTEAFIWQAICLTGRTEDERFKSYGEFQYGKEFFVGFRLWDHDRKAGIFTVDYVFRKYDWQHAVECDGAQHK